MLFSVIIPIYNTEKYLKKCIESVLRQNFKEFEIIMVDDGSTDGSGKICDIYSQKDSRIKVIHKQNEGQARARNDAIISASGEYIVFLDSDDFIDEGLLVYLSRVILRYHPDIVIYQLLMVNERNVKRKVLDAHRDIQETLLDQRALWTEFLEKSSVGGWAWNKCINRELLLSNSILFPSVKAREDAFFMSELFRHIERAVLTNFLGYFQLIRYGSTEQKKFTSDFFLSIEISQRNLEYVKDKFPNLYWVAFTKVVNSKLNCLKNMTADKKVKEYQVQAEWIKESLAIDIEVLEKEPEYRAVCEEVKDALENSKNWKRICRRIAISRKKDRMKRFIYAKIF